jgi:uncharacterized oxidoreductase
MGCPADSADKVARSLLKSDMRESDTHGLGLLPMYSSMVNAGAINPRAEISITHKTDSIIHVDGHNGFGQLTGELASSAAIKAAQKSGLAVVAIDNAAHLGRLGEWAEQAADAGLVFMAFSNTGGGAKNVAAFGGHERKLSTNPVAFAIPTFEALPFNIVVDFATSQVSGSVIREHNRTGKALHDDWTTTVSGEPVVDAHSFMNGEGALLPLGGRTTGHKGYGLAIVAELLGGIAGGMVVGQHHPEWFNNAAIFNLLDPLHFLEVGEIEQRVTAIATHLDEEKVRLPGQGSYERATLAKKQGVSIPSHILSSLAGLADELNVNITDEISKYNDHKTADDGSFISW